VIQGKLKCLGTSSQLKHQFSNGYQLSVSLNHDSNNQNMLTLLEFLKSYEIIPVEFNSNSSINNTEKIENIWKFLLQHDLYNNNETDIDNTLVRDESIYKPCFSTSAITMFHLLQQWLARKNEYKLFQFLLALSPNTVLIEKSSEYSFCYFLSNNNNNNNDNSNKNYENERSNHQEEEFERKENNCHSNCSGGTGSGYELSLSTLFRSLQNAMELHSILDFSLSQLSLEQIFNRLAANE